MGKSIDNSIVNAPDTDFVVEHIVVGNSWARKYKSGFMEQGGVYDNGGTVAGFTATINFLAPFKDAPAFLAHASKGVTSSYNVITSVGNVTATNALCSTWRTGGENGCRYLSWHASGF